MAFEDKNWHQDIPNHQSTLKYSYTNTALRPETLPIFALLIQQRKQHQG